MNTSNLKKGLSVALGIILCIVLLFQTCEPKKKVLSSTPIPDSIFQRYWQQEKEEKQALIQAYEKKITGLEKENRQLGETVVLNKAQLKQSRAQVRLSQERLRLAVKQLFVGDSASTDTLSSLLDQSEITVAQSDSACDSLVRTLEQTIVNKDSVIFLQGATQEQLIAIQQQQELNCQALSQELEKSVKQERKKNRQVKWLGRGIILLGGIVAGLFVVQQAR